MPMTGSAGSLKPGSPCRPATSPQYRTSGGFVVSPGGFSAAGRREHRPAAGDTLSLGIRTGGRERFTVDAELVSWRTLVTAFPLMPGRRFR